MAGRKSRKKGGGDTKCLEKLQEQHNKLMGSFRSILSVELSFLFPAMVGIPHLNKLDEIGQFTLLSCFLLMGYVGTAALILSHSTDAMRWSGLVSKMTFVVTASWIGLFHITIALQTPAGWLNLDVVINIILFMGGAIRIALVWEQFFQRPKCGKKTLNNEDLRKKGVDTKRLEKLQEHHNKLMESFRSLLSCELSFLLPAMVGLPHLCRNQRHT